LNIINFEKKKRDNNIKSAGFAWFTISYIPMFSEKFNRLNSEDIRILFNKLHEFIKVHKDPLPHEKKSNVVYKIAEHRNHIRWNTTTHSITDYRLKEDHEFNVILDVCSLDQELTLLQQGCDITGGNYLKVPQLAGLLQYLLWVFLPDPSVRSKLVLPPPVKVDYRAACFCHQELIDIGYVCSICLSIFCKFSPICTTCHTVFKMPGPMPIKMKKKKKNVDIVH
ncbi:TF2H3 factor, partial [Acromyrmex charruanus]